MGVIPAQKLEQVRALVKTLPLRILRMLEGGLALTQDKALNEVRILVGLALEFHHVKEVVFQPYVPLFSAREDGLEGVQFPKWVLDNLWKALEVHEPHMFAEARTALRGLRSDDPTPVVFYRLVTAAAELARTKASEILPRGADEEDADTLEEFAYYLDLHRLVRAALLKLPEWMGRMDAEKSAGFKLMFKDASQLSDEGGHRFMEVLFAHLEDGPLILKFVATVSERPSDRFLSESELADFGERILDQAEARLKIIEPLLKKGSGGTHQLADAAQKVAQCLFMAQGIEKAIELSRDGPWGKRVANLHKVIATLVEGQLGTAEKIISSALPLRSERVYGKVKREVPQIEPPSEAVTLSAFEIIAFMNHIRPAASHGGYATLLGKTVQAGEAVMDAYFDACLGIATGEEPFDADGLMACFERVADLMEALCGEEKANIARRRVASADLYHPSKNVA